MTVKELIAPSREAVEAALDAWFGPTWRMRDAANDHRRIMRAALTAALPHLLPQQMLPERLAALEKQLGKQPWPANFAGMNRDIALELLNAVKANLTLRDRENENVEMKKSIEKIREEVEGYE